MSGERSRLGEGALDWVEGNEWRLETPTGSERTQWERCGGGRHRLGESALDRVGGVREEVTNWEIAHL